MRIWSWGDLVLAAATIHQRISFLLIPFVPLYLCMETLLTLTC